MSTQEPFGQPAGPPPQPPRKGSLTWLWILLAILIVILLLCGGLCAGFGWFGWRFAQQAMPRYQESVERVTNSEEVQEILGEPIQPGVTSFNMQSEPGGDEAAYSFRVSGPQGSADVQVELEQVNDNWEYRQFDVTFEDGTVLDLTQ